MKWSVLYVFTKIYVLGRIHKMLDDGMTSKQIRGTLTHLKRPTLYDMIKRYQDSKVAGGGDNGKYVF
jgi:hypothetical protein